nr:MAG: DUF882 domain-containing protein [Hyphomicrobiales bacterium]
MNIHRRHFLGATGALVISNITTSANALVPENGARRLGFVCTHTGEHVDVEYWAKGRYVPDATAEIDHVLRDFRSGEVHPIDPSLLDLLYSLHSELDSGEPFSVISGYRSPTTNASLQSKSNGVATNSLHMRGMAIDIRLPGRKIADLHRAALALQAGGVGYYPVPEFVHVDVGRVRRW